MKRALALLVGGGLILGSVLTAHAQAPTVSFGGQMRVYGFTFNNITDFRDSDNGAFRDSQSFYFQRFRLFTTIESADKKARAYWSLEIGDITWGSGGGAGGGEYGCTGAAPIVNPTVTVPPPAGSPPGTPNTPATVTSGSPSAGTRVGPGAGGCFGNDGVNVETKNIWIWHDTSGWVPGTDLRVGLQNIVFMAAPWGAFLDDDAAAITVNWKGDPVDVQVWTAKVAEFNNANADDVDMYTARVGVNLTKDFRVTLEGLVVNNNNLGGHDFGDTFWVGGTVAVKVATISLDGGFVYGQRKLPSAPAGTLFEESGYGGYVIARAPVGPVNVNAIFWYTSGDDTRGPCGQVVAGGCNSNGPLTKDSDKLPIPVTGSGWNNSGMPFVAEWLGGLPTIGNPAVGQDLYNDPTGTWGVGGSATFALTPALSVGGGVAWVNATDAQSPKWGDWVFEIDGGLIYRFNPNVTMNLLAGYLIPDENDSAWALAWRTQFAF
jgi:hypothetical protein